MRMNTRMRRLYEELESAKAPPIMTSSSVSSRWALLANMGRSFLKGSLGYRRE